MVLARTYERLKIPTSNLVETVYNKWLQQSNNKMTCMYEATVDDLIRAFMHMTSLMTWLKGGSIGKGPNSTSLKLNVVAWCGDPKLLVDVLKSYCRAKDLNNKDCTLEALS